MTLTTSASGSFEASITLKKDARIALDNVRVEYEPGKGLPRLSSRFSNNFNNLQIQKLAVLQGSATLSGSDLFIIVIKYRITNQFICKINFIMGVHKKGFQNISLFLF